MKERKMSLRVMAVLIVVLIVLSAMLAYLVLRKEEEEPEHVGPPRPCISLGYSTNYDEWDIVEWPVVSGSNMRFSYLTFQLKDQQGNIFTLKAKTVPLSNFTAENLKNDTEYQLYFYDAYTLPYNTKGFMDGGDEFMVKAPADGYYILRIIYLMSTNLCQTNLTKF